MEILNRRGLFSACMVVAFKSSLSTNREGLVPSSGGNIMIRSYPLFAKPGGSSKRTAEGSL